MKAQVRKNGGSLYLKIDPYWIKQRGLREGDWVEYEIKSIEPAISQDFAEASVRAEKRVRGGKKGEDGLAGNWAKGSYHKDIQVIAATPEVIEEMLLMGGT